jgi:ribosomal protein S18 acetylase RimI-like enzyme
MPTGLDREITIVRADLDQPRHQAAIVELTNAYAMDPLGNAAALSAEVTQRLIQGLKSHPTTIVFLAWDQEQPVGIATCFLGFSTFAAKPLINIHDLAVLASHRGSGIGRQLLLAVEQQARHLGCVKLTLEVLENNQPARHLYESSGFAQATYTAEAGGALFLAKPL